jgi:glucans biosynthesis protein
MNPRALDPLAAVDQISAEPCAARDAPGHRAPPETTRRALLSAALGGVAACALSEARAVAEVSASPQQDHPFRYEDVIARARRLAASPFDATIPALPDVFADLGYDAYRDIRFRRNKVLLDERGPFELQLMHLGFLFHHPIAMNIIRDGFARPIAYSPDLFNFGRTKPDPSLRRPDLGFAGFRLLYALNDPTVLDEVISFLGASYFRFLGRQQKYGLSARGLAINSGMPEKEEFPFYREFWLEQPLPGATRAVIYALLDSPSVAGAYRFTIVPGPDTTVDVAATLFPRETIRHLGIAPLTSMFLYGENDRRPADDFRPEVHDSDGVLIHTNQDEWLWRPLRNPSQARVSWYEGTDPRGFGLFQRDRDYDHYEDLEAYYHLRPSYWVEPIGQWGPGHVNLVELPAKTEGEDNIVLYWTPKDPFPPGQPLDINYRLTAVMDGTRLHGLARATNMFQTFASAFESHEVIPLGTRRFLVDFRGGDLAYHLAQPEGVQIDATTSNGRILRTSLAPNPETKGFRAAVDVTLAPGLSTDLRVALKAGEQTISETWTGPWTSPRP